MIDIFNHGPYTDLHRLNLDWMIGVLKKIDDENIRQYVIDKLVEWLNDGTLSEIITEDVLNRIYNELNLLNQKARFIFPENGSTDLPVGESMILVLGSAAYIFDFGYRDPDTIIQAMRDAGVTRIAGIILSHYHNDHVGGVKEHDEDPTTIKGMKKIVNAFSTTGAVAYLPHGQIDWSRCTGDYTEIRDAEALVEAYLNEKTIRIIHPAEGDTVTIDPNTKLRFNNLDPAYFEDYYGYTQTSTGSDGGGTTYNNFSMVTEIFHMQHKAVYTGDIQEPAEAHVIGAVQSADLFVVEHHGVNRPVAEDYVANVTPEIAVIPTGAKYQNRQWFGKTDISKLLAGCEQVVVTAEAGNVTVISGAGGLIMDPGTAGNLNLMYTMQTLTYGRMLQGEVNLDTLLYPGEYSSQNAQQSALLINSPFTGSGFKLQVIQATPANALLQIAYTTGSAGQAVAMRWRDTTANPTWKSWRYLYPSNYYNVILEDRDLSFCTVQNNSFNQCHVIMTNNVIDVSLDIMTGESGVPDNEHIVTIPVDTYGRGAYFELVNPVNLSERYLARLSFETSTRSYFVAPNVALPANTHLVGHVTMVGYPYN